MIEINTHVMSGINGNPSNEPSIEAV